MMANEARTTTLTRLFRESAGVVLTDYRGLTTAQLTEVRTHVGEGTCFTVVKNTLARVAVRQAGTGRDLESFLHGPSAIAFVTGDMARAARRLRDFSRANPFLVIKGGLLGSKFLTPDDIMELAEADSQEDVLARLAGTMKSSQARFLSLCAQLPARQEEGNMATLSTAELLDAFREMTLSELTAFVREFESEFNVQATVSLTSGGPGETPEVPAEEEEQAEFDVILESAGAQKIQVIKEVRKLTGLGLKDAKDLVDNAPRSILEGIAKERAEQAAAALIEAGAGVTLR